MAEARNFFHFENVTVEPQEFRVTRDGESVVLTPRAFDVLIVLLQNAGRVVEKQEIFDVVWKDTFVTDNALVKVIRELRSALGDDSENPHLIETLPKRGYRFIAEVSTAPAAAPAEPESVPDDQEHEVSSTTDTPAGRPATGLRYPIALALAGLVLIAAIVGWYAYPQPAADSSQQIRSMAVLPFKPLSPESRDESLEMGMAETLINRLSTLRNLAVRPITSVRKFTDPSQDPVKAGEEARVDSVLDGTIQKAGDRIRITVRLIDVATGEALWNEKFDENLTDIFKVQDSIAERVTNALALQLSRQEREQLVRHETGDPEAYQHYLQCQLIFHGRRANWLNESQNCYKAVVAKDPNFALAYIGVAETSILLTGSLRVPAKEGGEIARENIARALEIDPNLAQAHNALAELKYQFEYDWSGAEQEFKKALELNPNVSWIHQAYGWFLMCQGRFPEAAVEMDKAKSLDPTTINVDVARGRLYYYSRDYEAARQTFERLIKLEPKDISIRLALMSALERQEKYEEAAEHWFILIPMFGAPPEVVERARAAFERGGWQALCETQLEMLQEGAKKGSPPATLVANQYARLGRKEECFQALERAFENKEPGILQLKIDPLYDGIRDDPRFAGMLSRIGLTP